MSSTRSAWWDRARWYFLMYALVMCIAFFANPSTLVLAGWKIALFISALTAAVGTAGTLRVVMGIKACHRMFHRLEFVGFGGIVLFEMSHGLYFLYRAWTDADVSAIARAATHMSISIAIGLSYRSRPVRERSVIA